VTYKHGVRLKKYVVDPLLQYLQGELDKYINKNSWQTDLHIIYRLKFVANMYDSIKTGVLASDIIKYIAPYFALIKTDESEIKQIEGSIIEPVIKPKQKTKTEPVIKQKSKTKVIPTKKLKQDSDSELDSVEEFMKDLREIKALQKQNNKKTNISID